MRMQNNLWKVPAYLPNIKPALSDAIVAKCEDSIGFTLPKSLIDLLTERNGGAIRKVFGDRYPGGMIWGIGGDWPSISAPDWADVRSHIDFELDGLIPFDGDGHWSFCLDYRGGKDEPKITYIDVELNEQEEVATSFDEFIEKLKLPDLNNCYVIYSEELISGFVDSFGREFGLRFSMQDPLFSSGYDAYSCELDSVRIWLTSNLVKCGYSRKGKKYAEEYGYLLNEDCFQFPEVSESCVLVKLVGGEHSGVLDRLRQKYDLHKITDIIEPEFDQPKM